VAGRSDHGGANERGRLWGRGSAYSHTRRDRSDSWWRYRWTSQGFNRPAPAPRAWGTALFAWLSRTIGPRPSLKFADNVNLVPGTLVDRLLSAGHQVVGIDKLSTRVAGDKPPVTQRKTAVVVHRPDTRRECSRRNAICITTTMFESLNVSVAGLKVFNLSPAESARRADEPGPSGSSVPTS
jgi:hypothetical protein